ncbi:MAG TPA: acetolactate synthase large subunit [Candidatus Binatia bacterium]|nr:acetolactate synthase large subunit [Candidatus Binatia bacterium]
MKAAELLVRCLENEGVQYIFGVPGEEIMDLLDSLRDSTITFVPTRHEQGAAFMADVYGRLSGKAGVCLSTLGPGATNLMTGVADATMDHSPVVALTGQVSLGRMHKESHQCLDLESLFRPITKWSAQIKKAEIIPEAVRKAFTVAQTEKPGATHLDLPEDIAKLDVDEEPLQEPGLSPPSVPLTCQLERAAQLIATARYPLVVAGNGVARAGASAALVRFAEALNLPVATTFMAKGTIPFAHPLALGVIGLQHRDAVAWWLDRADVVVAVGYDLVEYAPARWNPRRDKKIVHLDLSPAEVDAAYTVVVEVIGDLSASLSALAMNPTSIQAVCPPTLREALVAELAGGRTNQSFPVKPQRLLWELRAAMEAEDIVISDVGAHKLWIARLYPCEQPNTCIISNGFASMGIALPGAVAAKLLFPHKKVVAVTGDGGFLMNSQELETAVRLGLPIVIVICNDGSYGLIGWKQQARFGREAFVKFGNPDFVCYAESFGARGYRVEAADDLPYILQEAFVQRGPVVIDCAVDYSENLTLTEKLRKLTPAEEFGKLPDADKFRLKGAA